MPLLSGADPLIGHARELRASRLTLFDRAAREGKPFARLSFLGRRLHMGVTPAVAHEVLVEKAKHFEKGPPLRLVLEPLAGQGLFTSEGELWKRQRRLMAPLFQPAALARYIDAMVSCTERVVGSFREGQPVEINREMTRLTMAVVGKTLFDADTFEEADALGEALTYALHWAGSVMSTPRMAAQLTLRFALEDAEPGLPARVRDPVKRVISALHKPVMLPGYYGRELRDAIGTLDARVQQMIDARRARGTSGEQRDLLDALLSARDDEAEGGADGAMSDRQLRDEAVTLFIAGHETTATALAWVFYFLSKHPEHWERLREEALRVPATEPRKLEFAARLFKEAMRIYPPVYILARRAVSPVTVGGYDFDKGQMVSISPYAVHRQPDVWPDPERFDPDRFAPEKEAARPRSAYLPFGYGQRVCIGNHFALMEGPILLSTIARSLRFEIARDLVAQPTAVSTLRPDLIDATVRFYPRG